MVLSWTSATNCTRIYNAALATTTTKLPADWKFGSTLTSDHVYNGFMIYCLLEDLIARKQTLSVPHKTCQDKDRYLDAIRVRNQRMRLYSQPVVRHYCNKCTRFNRDGKFFFFEFYVMSSTHPTYWHTITGNKKISVVVIDGVTIGHPCCGIHNCQIPLSSNRNRFCDDHKGNASICSIVGCSAPITSGDAMTCDNPDHRAVEKLHRERGQSRFQLQQRLERARIVHPNDALGTAIATISDLADCDEEEEEFILGSSDLPTQQQRSSTTKKLSARFGRKRTHNEQLIVAPCGMIIARETFFGAEAVSSVVVHFC
jgi:hypothetical protein